MVEMFLVVFAAMTFVVVLISLIVFIIDIIIRKKSNQLIRVKGKLITFL